MSRPRTTESPELALLAEATQLLTTARNPERALQPLVSLVKQRLGTEVCSLYLLEPVGPELVLVATDGLAAGSIGRVRMHPGEGLTGLVAEARAPVAVPEAARHPRFRYFPETGEERYHSFLGVPLIRRGAVEGVLVVQTREARRFARDEVRTLAAVAAQLAGHLAGIAEKAPTPGRESRRGMVFPSIAACVRDPQEVGEALGGRPQALLAAPGLEPAVVRAICDAAPGTVTLISCEAPDLGALVSALREAASRSPLRFAVAGATEAEELAVARRSLAEVVGAGADVALGAAIDSAVSALSVRALASAADFFLLDTTAFARSTTAGRHADPFVPAVLRLVARTLHGAQESGRPSFLAGALVEAPEGWLAAAGLGASVIVPPVAELARVRRFARRVDPEGATQAARRALRAKSAAEAKALLADGAHNGP
jgi:signal transduction protein with GAF and PtsI domain